MEGEPRNSRRWPDMPPRTVRSRAPLIERCAPLSETSFPSIDLLPATDKRNNYSPIGVSLHDLEEKGGLRLWSAELLGPILRIPGALSLIEDNDLVRRSLFRMFH